ncbi:MAG: iron-containing alcohol dehydrogenase, partial [Lachnospiraceae bacterium]
LTHGEGMAIVLPAWIRYISKVNPGKTSQLYVRVFNGDVYTNTDEENTLLLADTLENFFISLGLRTRLSKLDIGSDRFEAMAKRATRNGKVGHYIPLGVEEIVAILTIALSGSGR